MSAIKRTTSLELFKQAKRNYQAALINDSLAEALRLKHVAIELAEEVKEEMGDRTPESITNWLEDNTDEGNTYTLDYYDEGEDYLC